jgi:dTDP-4-amino-4,6-dideoxygalactose transaminase
MSEQIWLSPPDVSEADLEAIVAAFRSGWVAPAGPDLAAFESDLATATGRRHAVALSSGTAALHLALITHGIGRGHRVGVQSLTFAATANAVDYVGAQPVFIDSDPESWNLDPRLVEQAIETHDLDAIIAVDLYGQPADYTALEPMCRERGVVLISDAAESLGSSHHGSPGGSFGDSAALSFNGNKIITTSGGGAFVTNDQRQADHVRKLATQAREPVVHYEHTEIGFNYRMSNLLAALGRSQLSTLADRVDRRRGHRRFYQDTIGTIEGVEFMPEPAGNRSTFWLTALTVDPDVTGTDREEIRHALNAESIESRPVWKPMHLQPVWEGEVFVGDGISDTIFANGLCLPSGTTLSDSDRERIADIVLSVLQ